MVASRSWLCLPSTSSMKPVAASSSTSPPSSHHCRLLRRQSKGVVVGGRACVATALWAIWIEVW